MSYLIFCSFEVGGLPYKMAEVLNRHGVQTYYVSLAWNTQSHDSTAFHYGNKRESWDLSLLLDRGLWSFRKNIKALRRIKFSYGIDYCFATGHKAYLLSLAGMDYGYWCYGSDLDEHCKSFVFPQERGFWRKRISYLYFLLKVCSKQKMFIPAEYALWRKGMIYLYFLLRFRREQRNSILNASSLTISNYQLVAYKRLCPDKRLFFLPHLINVMEYHELCKRKAENKKKVCQGIGAENFFFSSSKHFWHGENSSFKDCKGNDVILHSFVRYLRISGDKKSRLILVRKGPDVEQSERLIQELDIDNYCIWVDEMRRDDLWVYYQGASMCFGQFGEPVLTYAAVEPLSNAGPCVSFAWDNNTTVPFYNTMPPILNSKDPEKIAHFMDKITSDPEYAREVSYNSWLWAKENCSQENFVRIFEEISKKA